MSRRKWLRLPGTRYRCVPLYISGDEFDPLSQLFLEVLRYETDLSRLVRAFGLTERVVEDVLGDLIRRNLATLVIQDRDIPAREGGHLRQVKHIKLLKDSIPNVVYEPGLTLDVWQDHWSGIVLPAAVVDPYGNPHRGGNSAGEEFTLDDDTEPPGERQSEKLVAEFREAPDSVLIEMLIRADSALRQRDETAGELDRLSDRYRVKPQTVWLPVEEAELQGRVIRMLVGEQLPSWVARTWSAAMLHHGKSQQGTNELIGFHAAVAEENYRIVNGWRATTRLDAWRDAVERFLSLTPVPVSGYDLRAVREQEASLRGLFLAIGQVELLDVTPDAQTLDWLAPVFDASRHWVVLVLRSPEQMEGLVAWLLKRGDSGIRLPNSLFLSVPPGTPPGLLQTLHELLGASRSLTIINRRWPSTGPAAALGDGTEGRFLYAPGAPVLRFAGARLMSAWRGILQALPEESGARTGEAEQEDTLKHLRVRRPPSPAEEENVVLGSNAHTVKAVVEEVRAFGEKLLTAIIDPEQLMIDPAAPDADVSIPPVKFDRYRALIEQLPTLSESCDDLCYKLSLYPMPPWSFWTHLTPHDLLATLVAVLTEPDRRSVEGELHILANNVAEELLQPSVVHLIENAVITRGWTLQIGLPLISNFSHGGASSSILSTLRERIPSPRLKFQALRRPAPMHALVLDNLTFIAGGDWLGSTLQQQIDPADFGFAVESKELAESLRAYFIDAEEVLVA